MRITGWINIRKLLRKLPGNTSPSRSIFATVRPTAKTLTTQNLEYPLKRILITGANKGIGLATVSAILEQYDDALVLLGTRDPQRGMAAIDSLKAQYPDKASRLELVTIDVADEQSVLHARDDLISRFGQEPLYGLVNNAGIGLGSADLAGVLNVNTLGVKRVCDAFIPLIQSGGRLVNVSSASGPKFVSECSSQRQAFFQDKNIEWDAIAQLMEQALANAENPGNFATLGIGDLNPYGLSKACVSLYTILLARQYPELCINACTPGYIETDLTRPQASRQGVDPADMGMKPPAAGTRSILFLLFGNPAGSGDYYGSDAKRSPLDRYRAPGDPEYTGK
jgi:carbonyl reductase 1